jgi:hypothetical protein
MDALDRLAGPAQELLSRVDATLRRTGAPADHPLWPLLDRLRGLPTGALATVAALRPAPLSAAGSQLRALSRQYAEWGYRPAGSDEGWRGPAAEAFTARWVGLCAYVGHGLAGRLADSAEHAETVADWMGRTRLALARTLALVMASAEAVTVTVTVATGADPAQAARAAADIAARVLGTVADAYAQADALLAEWPDRLAELPLTPPPVPPVPAGTGSLEAPL